MKKFACFLIVLAMASSLLFAGGSADKKPTGKIVIYTSMYEEVVEVVKNELQKDFPKCTIEFVFGGTGRMEYRVATERAAGKLGCDILMLAETSFSLEMKERNMLHPYLSKEALNLAFEYDPAGYWYPVRINNMVLAFNPDLNPRNTLPHSFYDFANDSRVRNAIAIRNPSISGTSLAALSALRDKYGYEYFDALSRQGIHLSYGNEAITQLESGEYKIIMVLEESILQRRQIRDSTLEVIYPTDGTVMIPSTIMIVDSKWSANKNIHTAEKITDWFLSEKGQNAIVDGWMHSVRADFPRVPYDSLSTTEIRRSSIPVNWERNYLQKEEIQLRFDENVAGRRGN